MATLQNYTPQQFNLSGLTGISDQTLEMHFKLYEGYVHSTNVLTTKITEILRDGKIDPEEMPAYSELTRRLGFEYNFGNLTRDGSGDPGPGSDFRRAAETSFGRYDLWKADFIGVGKMRGVGWAICYQDPTNGRLSNHWVTLHEVGNVSGVTPFRVAVPSEGRLGARIPPRLQAGRAAAVHRGVLHQCRLAKSRGAHASRVREARHRVGST
jgi:Fe-Mn family superoxide dismutase